MEYKFRFADELFGISITKTSGNTFGANLDGKQLNCEFTAISDNCLLLRIGTKMHTIYYAEENNRKYVFINGEQYDITDVSAGEDRAVRPHEELGTGREVCAPMPGKILKILVAENDTVVLKQPLFIVESMKMENQVCSHMPGRVIKINFKNNDLVSTGDVVIELEKIQNS